MVQKTISDRTYQEHTGKIYVEGHDVALRCIAHNEQIKFMAKLNSYMHTENRFELMTFDNIIT